MTKHTLRRIGKDIRFEGPGDYACYLDGQYIGSASSYTLATTKIDALAYEILTHARVTDTDMAADAAEETR